MGGRQIIFFWIVYTIRDTVCEVVGRSVLELVALPLVIMFVT